MQKSLLFKIHAVSGLVLGFFILLMSLSGAVLVFHSELDQLTTPHKAGHYPVQELNKAYVLLKTYYPAAQVSHCELSDPVSFSIYDRSYKNGKSPMQVFLDPSSNSILKTRGGSDDFQNNFMSWLSRFHNSFHLGKTGEWLLGFFALVFLLSIITGLTVFRKSIPAVLFFKKAVYKRKNLHQIIGVYALLFNLVIAVTGFWMQRYVFKKEFYAANNYTRLLKASPDPGFSFDTAFSEIKKRCPDFTAHVIYFAQNTNGKTAIYGSRASNAYIHSKKMADVIFLDSAGNIHKTRFINEIDPADRYDIINSQLHMGRFGGTGIQVIYFVFGLSGGLLSITGFLMWLRRQKEKRELPG